MTIIVLDPRFPTAIPLEAANLLTGEVSYTEEVPIRVRWAIADAGGHSASGAEVLVTTDVDNDDVVDRIAAGERVFNVGLENAAAPAPAAALPSSAAQAPTAATTPAATDGTAAASNASGTTVSPVSASGSAPASASARPGDGTATARFPRVEQAIDVMAAARRTGEWEAGQTHASLLPYLIEEAFEFIDAVNEGGDIRGELSDLLLQVLFQAEVADDFDIDDVAGDFVEKLRRRKPYLFDGSVDVDGDGDLMPLAEQEAAWSAGRGGPRSQPAEFLPALALAEEAIRRARARGMSDSDIPVELLCPTPGLELESGAEARTRAVARAFLAELELRGPGPEDDEAGHGSDLEPDHDPEHDPALEAEEWGSTDSDAPEHGN
ncbi:MazG nucleotide pyrophosphohydrolase domain-containing protein [uncultured Corynebacterium sp.]|uniref:MazG nucleotide pyrophosphohydrolase domain-containing protein n=1 Tax=uncultured Corynebacterium sp. TaxID=159447 RepID=UPI0025E5FCF0|nr:MazG nucleotide pyrophosphohydrolase domain-containing protein [uncultured Corynebacterium sp.]